MLLSSLSSLPTIICSFVIVNLATLFRTYYIAERLLQLDAVQSPSYHTGSLTENSACCCTSGGATCLLR